MFPRMSVVGAAGEPRGPELGFREEEGSERKTGMVLTFVFTAAIDVHSLKGYAPHASTSVLGQCG